MNGNDSFLLDTNIVLGFLNGHEAIVKFFNLNLLNKTLKVSQITRMELLGFPNITPDEESKLKSFLSLVDILPITDLVCDESINVRRSSRLKLPDAMIVASALIYNHVLVTCDTHVASCKLNEFKAINPLVD